MRVCWFLFLFWQMHNSSYFAGPCLVFVFAWAQIVLPLMVYQFFNCCLCFFIFFLLLLSLVSSLSFVVYWLFNAHAMKIMFLDVELWMDQSVNVVGYYWRTRLFPLGSDRDMRLIKYLFDHVHESMQNIVIVCNLDYFDNY